MFNALNIPSLRVPPKKEWPPGASGVRTKFGQDVLWWEKSKGGYHVSEKELERYRQLGDGRMDRILYLLEKEGRPLAAGDDLISLAEEAHKNTKPSERTKAQKEMCQFLETYQSLPKWVDKDQLKRGQEVFMAYSPVAGLALYYRSLVAGFSIPKIAAVVRSTGYLTPPSRPDQVLQRLIDTGELTSSCTGLGIDSLLPGGIGWRITLCVRVLHAKVRHRLLGGGGGGKKKWNTELFGVPINQEDMAATLLAFSVNVICGIELIAGTRMSDGEKADYLALWRYIGWLLGVETSTCERVPGQPSKIDLPPLDPCSPHPPSSSSTTGDRWSNSPILKASSLLQSIIFHLLDPDNSSIEIAHHLLKITDRKPPSPNFSKIPASFYMNDLFYFRALQCRRLIGDPLADALQLPYHPIWWKRWKLKIKSTMILLTLRVYTLAGMWIPFCRNLMIGFHGRFLVQFHENWTKTHKSKMHKALQTGANGGSCLHNPTSGGGDDITGNSQLSICPFPMVALPQ